MKTGGFKIKWYHLIILGIVVFVVGYLSVSGLDCPSPSPECCTMAPGGTDSYWPSSMFIFLGFLFVLFMIPTVVIFFVYRRLSKRSAESKIAELGSELGVREEDVREMRKTGIRLKLIKGILAFFVSLLYLVIFALGSNLKIASCPNIGYPYCCYNKFGLLPVALADGKNDSKVKALLISLTVFLIALNLTPVFGQMVMYNCFARSRNKR